MALPFPEFVARGALFRLGILDNANWHLGVLLLWHLLVGLLALLQFLLLLRFPALRHLVLGTEVVKP